jgi:hypothetical protein
MKIPLCAACTKNYARRDDTPAINGFNAGRRNAGGRSKGFES